MGRATVCRPCGLEACPSKAGSRDSPDQYQACDALKIPAACSTPVLRRQGFPRFRPRLGSFGRSQGLELPLLSDAGIESLAQLPAAFSLPVLRRSRFSLFRPRSPFFGLKLGLLSDGRLEPAVELLDACLAPPPQPLLAPQT